jgi:MerR family transcriptional regulator, mercuric resistance operon regulatory protein
VSGLRISQVAEAVGVNTETLRYYERRGVLPKPDRTLGGHRLYSEDAVTVLRVIKAAQRLGFSLDEVAELITAGRHHHRAQVGQSAGTVNGGLQQKAAQKLAEVEAKIADLQVIASTLRATLDAECDDLMTCAAHDDCCPIPFATIATVPVGGRDAASD